MIITSGIACGIIFIEVRPSSVVTIPFISVVTVPVIIGNNPPEYPLYASICLR